MMLRVVNVFLIMAICALVFLTIPAHCDEITIGTGTGAWNYPLSTYYHDARTQTIYLASEIGMPCRINALALYVTTPPGQTMNYFTIRMKHTALNFYTGGQWESTGWTTVYQTNQSISGTGWITFTSPTPFDYDGVNNLMVDISFNNTSWTTDGQCRYTTASATRSLYFRTDSGYGDPLTWSGTNPPPGATTAVTNVKLTVEPSSTVARPNFAPDGGAYNAEQDIVITCSTPGAEIHYTTNGIDPETTDPIISSGSSVHISSPTTLKAKAWKDGLDPSSVKSAVYVLKPATPTFTPDAGSFPLPTTVTIACATPGADVRYTITGSDPQDTDSLVIGPIPISGNTILKARAFKAGWSQSDVKTGNYTITGEVTIGTGMNTWYYPLATYYPISRTQTIYLKNEINAPYRLTGLSLDVTTVPARTMGKFTIRMKHTALSSYGSGSWESSGWTTVFQGDKTISSTGWANFQFDAPFEYNGVDNLMIDMSFYDTVWSYSYGYCRYSSPGGYRSVYNATSASAGDPLTWSATTPSAYTTSYVPNIKLQVESLTNVATPSFTPIGGLYNAVQNVIVKCVTPGADIYYTTNGVDPERTDALIESGSSILVDHDLTLKAKAWKDGLDPSYVRIAGYSFIPATPDFSPPGGIYQAPQTVTVTCATTDAVIHYTIDGTEPDESDPTIALSGTIPINVNTTLKAKAFRTGWPSSVVKSADYSFSIAPLAFTPDTGTYPSAQAVRVDCSTPGIEIHYLLLNTTDEIRDPTMSDPTVEPGSTVLVDHNCTLKAKAFRAGWTQGTTKSALYFIGDPGRLYVDQNSLGPAHDGTTWMNAFLTITQALNYAISGNEVWVARGGYGERITVPSGVALYGSFCGWETELWERQGPMPPWGSCQTTIDGQNNGTVVTIPAGASSLTRVDGFSIGHGYSEMGGGIMCGNNSSPVIANNEIFYNQGGYSVYGVGIYCGTGSSPTITDNYIHDNTAPTGSYTSSSGGGIYCDYLSTPLIKNNRIYNNSAQSGGGICSQQASPVIIRNHIYSNTATGWYSGVPDPCMPGYGQGGSGAGVYCGGGSPIISGNWITSNSAESVPGYDSAAGGVFINAYYAADSATVVNNTITHNSATRGSGVCCVVFEQGSAIIANNIVAFNQWGYQFDSWNGAPPTAATLRNNNVYYSTNSPGNYNTANGMSAGLGDISRDPLLSDGLHLSQSSPCINMGWNDAPEIGETDYDGGTRIVWDDIDIGVDEFDGLPKVATPWFSPPAGSYTTVQAVTINTAPGAEIRYTTDGSTVTTGSPLYTGPVQVGQALTLKAKAWKTGWTESDESSAAYTFKVATPSFSPPAGSYSTEQDIIIICAMDGAEIHYTTNNVEPTTGDPTIASGGSIHISQPTILKAKAWKSGCTTSDTATGRFIVRPVGVVRVDKNAPGPDHYGLTWSTAYLTIASALADAMAGDEIWVKKGTYVAHITLKNHVALYGGFAGTETARSQRPAFPRSTPDTNETIIDGNNGYPSVVATPFAAANDTRIDGFTIRNGRNWAGGGIYCQSGSPVIANNTITANVAEYSGGSNSGCGGGISVGNGGSPTITNNKISGNSAYAGYQLVPAPCPSPGGFYLEGGGGVGGGVYADYNSSPVIVNNTISGNHCYGVYYYAGGYYTPDILCLAQGAGIGCRYGGNPTIANNLILNNTAHEVMGMGDPQPGQGSAVYAYGLSNASTRICNNTIVGNTAPVSYGYNLPGPSVYLQSCSNMTLANNVVAWNDVGISAYGVNSRCNNVYGNTYGDGPGPYDIVANPMFVNMGSGDYHLQPGSPCIDAGYIPTGGLPPFDMDQQGRIFNSKVDIGADEYWGSAMSIPDAKRCADGANVNGTGSIVTAVFPGFFYIESPDRECGIRVKSSFTPVTPVKVDIVGALATNADGEKYIDATSVTPNGSGNLAPVILTCGALGGGDFHHNVSTKAGQKGVAGAVGLNNIGLLVTICGAFTKTSDTTFTLDDGSGVDVKCIVPEGITLNPLWTYASVVGISSCEKIGDDLHRLLRVRVVDAITPL